MIIKKKIYKKKNIFGKIRRCDAADPDVSLFIKRANFQVFFYQQIFHMLKTYIFRLFQYYTYDCILCVQCSHESHCILALCYGLIIHWFDKNDNSRVVDANE